MYLDFIPMIVVSLDSTHHSLDVTCPVLMFFFWTHYCMHRLLAFSSIWILLQLLSTSNAQHILHFVIVETRGKSLVLVATFSYFLSPLQKADA